MSVINANKELVKQAKYITGLKYKTTLCQISSEGFIYIVYYDQDNDTYEILKVNPKTSEVSTVCDKVGRAKANLLLVDILKEHDRIIY